MKIYKLSLNKYCFQSIGGETGIRTPEPVAQLLPFQGSAIDHSAISPAYW